MKLFEEFKQDGAKYDARLADLKAEKETLEVKLAEVVRQYEAGIEKDALGIAAFNDERKIEAAIKDVREEIEKVNRKMEIVRNGKRQDLTGKIPFLKEIRQREREDVDREWNECLEQLNRIKAEFLLALSALGEVNQKGEKVSAEYLALMEEADPSSMDDQRRWYGGYQSFSSLPWSPNTFYESEDKALQKALSVPDWAAKKAYTGKIPAWVSNYATTGEIKF